MRIPVLTSNRSDRACRERRPPSGWVPLSCGSMWFIDAGSVTFVDKPIRGRYLNQDDRIEIADCLAAGEVDEVDRCSWFCSTWMALASRPMRRGLRRTLCRTRQYLSWALARSPGPRSRACALLASFCDCGLRRPLYGVITRCLVWSGRSRGSPCRPTRSARPVRWKPLSESLRLYPPLLVVLVAAVVGQLAGARRRC